MLCPYPIGPPLCRMYVFMKTRLGVFKRKWWILLLLVILVSGGLFIRSRSAARTDAEKYVVKRETLKDTLIFPGSIDADEKATLQFQTGGRVSYVGAKEGDEVKKGQLIASLDQRQLQKTLEKYLNTYANQRTEFDNQKTEYDEKALPTDRYLRQDLIDAFKKAQNNLNNTVLDVELQNIALQYANLYSPINGVLVKAGARFAGVNVLATQPGYEIVNPETIYFSAAADQTEIVRMREGMRADISFDAFADRNVRGTIDRLGYMPKEGETGTVYEVRIALTGLDESEIMMYRIGMTGDATFTLKEYPNVISVPTTYVKTEGSRRFVYKQENNSIQKAYVKTGAVVDVSTEILEGLQEGDVIYDNAQ